MFLIINEWSKLDCLMSSTDMTYKQHSFEMTIITYYGLKLTVSTINVFNKAGDHFQRLNLLIFRRISGN